MNVEKSEGRPYLKYVEDVSKNRPGGIKVAGMKSTHTFCAALKLTILWFCVQVVYITEPLIKIH